MSPTAVEAAVKLSPEQIAQYAHDAGFRGQDLTTAVAVALAESAGRTTAHNGLPPDDSYGLWQINMYAGLGPERRRQFDLDSDRDLFDPETNARAAYEISGRGESFQPWTTYTSGAHRQFLEEARRGVEAIRRHPDRRPGQGADRGQHQGGGGGFLVDPEALSGYARGARTIADELAALRSGELRAVRSIAEDSFGRIGKETGFGDALNRFGESLRHQVRGIRRNINTLAGSVAKTARHYRDQEEELIQDLVRLNRNK